MVVATFKLQEMVVATFKLRCYTQAKAFKKW